MTITDNIFIQNKYTRWYISIIDNAKSQQRKKVKKDLPDYVYYESHHVVPRSIKPELTHHPENVVLLTAREHFICHYLLLKMTEGQNKYKMLNAFKMMCGAKKELRYTNSRLYEHVRKELRLSEEHKRKISEAGKERKHSDETKLKMSLAQKGIPKTEEHKQNLRGKERSEEVRKAMSLARKGKPSSKKGKPGKKPTEEARKKMSESRTGDKNHFYGKTHTDETRTKMKEYRANNPLPNITCEHCGKSNQKSMHIRWHGNNCKLFQAT